MSQTAVEKILSRVCGKPVEPGAFVIAYPDLIWIPSGFGMLAVMALKDLGVEKIKEPQKVLTWLVEPSFSKQIADADYQIEKWAKDQGIEVIRGGVPTASLVREGYAKPGTMIVGLDSHSPTLGGTGCLSLSVGDTELGVILASGNVWTRVPVTIAFRLTGSLPDGSSAKDIALKIIKDYGMDVSVNKVTEYIGPGVEKMDLWPRLTLCNMSVEMGAYSGFIPPNENIISKMGPNFLDQVVVVRTDDEECYEKVYDIDLGAVTPHVACPDSLANTEEISAIAGVPVTHAFLGSCTNAWISDLRDAAAILKGRTIAPGMRMLVSPVDLRTYSEADEEGLLNIFVKAGAIVTQPFCSMCSGLQNHLGPDHACVSSSGRNYKARMGHPDSKIYVASAATVAASAVRGCITDPREFLED